MTGSVSRGTCILTHNNKACSIFHLLIVKFITSIIIEYYLGTARYDIMKTFLELISNNENTMRSFMFNEEGPLCEPLLLSLAKSRILMWGVLLRKENGDGRVIETAVYQ